jgi:hypothetical protein
MQYQLVIKLAQMLHSQYANNKIDFLSKDKKMKNQFSKILKRVTPVTFGLLVAVSTGVVILLSVAVSIK